MAITFDDGNTDFYTEALPVLLRHGFTATVFVITGLTSGSSQTATSKLSEVERDKRDPRARNRDRIPHGQPPRAVAVKAL